MILLYRVINPTIILALTWKSDPKLERMSDFSACIDASMYTYIIGNNICKYFIVLKYIIIDSMFKTNRIYRMMEKLAQILV